MADAFDRFETLMTEKVEDAVMNLVLPDDDIAVRLIDAFDVISSGGRRTDDSAAGFEVSYRIQVARGGVVEGASWTGNTHGVVGANSHLFASQQPDDLYPDPSLVPSRSYIKIRLLLEAVKGNAVLNKKDLIAQMAGNPIEQIAADQVEDVVSRYRCYWTNYFYGNGTASLATVTNSATCATAAGGTAYTLANGTPFKFQILDRVQFCTPTFSAFRWDAGGSTVNRARVVNIDRKTRQIWLQADGADIVSVTAGDHIVLENTVVPNATPANVIHRVPIGIGGYLLDTGRFPGSPGWTGVSAGLGYDVTKHGYLRSHVSGDYAAPDNPTPEVIELFLDEVAEPGIDTPPVAIAERSIWSLYRILERQQLGISAIPQGGRFSASGGTDGPTLNFMEGNLMKEASNRVTPNTIEFINPADWALFAPFGRAIQWLYGNGPLANQNSIFMPVHASGRSTTFAEAPWDGGLQFGCKRPDAQGRRLGIRNLRDWTS